MTAATIASDSTLTVYYAKEEGFFDRAGLNVTIKAIPNPRKEAENHYYNPKHSGLLELGLKPHYLTDDRVAEMIEFILCYRDSIDVRKILPRVSWS